MSATMTPAEEIARWHEARAASRERAAVGDRYGPSDTAIEKCKQDAAEHRRLAAMARQIEQSALRQAAEVARAHAREFTELARDTGYTTQDEAAQISECNSIAEEIEDLIVGDNTGEKLAELAALTENWDSHGGRAINRDVLSLLELLLTVPAQAVPGSDGSVQLEWHGLDWDVEIRFADERDGCVVIYDWYIGRVGGPEHSGDD